MRKVAFCIAIDGLLQAKRRHIGKPLIISGLSGQCGLSGISGQISRIRRMSRIRPNGEFIGESILSSLPSGGLGWVLGRLGGAFFFLCNGNPALFVKIFANVLSFKLFLLYLLRNAFAEP